MPSQYSRHNAVKLETKGRVPLERHLGHPITMSDSRLANLRPSSPFPPPFLPVIVGRTVAELGHTKTTSHVSRVCLKTDPKRRVFDRFPGWGRDEKRAGTGTGGIFKLTMGDKDDAFRR